MPAPLSSLIPPAGRLVTGKTEGRERREPHKQSLEAGATGEPGKEEGAAQREERPRGRHLCPPRAEPVEGLGRSLGQWMAERRQRHGKRAPPPPPGRTPRAL